MRQTKEQWNVRIKQEIADAMRTIQENRLRSGSNPQSLRDLTEEAFVFFIHVNGIKIKDSQ
jgi:hypothetical protein|tara:strand:+ start:1453 stop:1635 length:183 start_codon:yes stop_codon:yes gene_type:complete